MRIADHRDVLLGPVISEKAWPARREQVHLPGASGREQDRDQDCRREGLRREGDRCEHPQPRWQARARGLASATALPRSVPS